MKEINGQFIMDGCAPDDPNRLDTAEQLVALLRTVGFLPLFSNAIPGFSVEERVPADRWWTDEESDPWAWRHMLADDYKTILDENGSSQRYKETISPSEGRKNR